MTFLYYFLGVDFDVFRLVGQRWLTAKSLFALLQYYNWSILHTKILRRIFFLDDVATVSNKLQLDLAASFLELKMYRFGDLLSGGSAPSVLFCAQRRVYLAKRFSCGCIRARIPGSELRIRMPKIIISIDSLRYRMVLQQYLKNWS